MPRFHCALWFSLQTVAPCLLAQDAPPVPSPGPFARLVVIEPKADKAAAFEAGYQRHLAWHRAHADPWHWYGWSFVLGERLGQFMDGTFGHAAADFDHPVDPAGDAADNAANVIPAATFRTHAVYERLGEARAPAQPDTLRYLALTTYWIRPGQEQAFEAAALATRDPGSICFRLRLGGHPPEYLLFQPVATWAEAIARTDPLARAPRASELIIRSRSELLRYRANLSYHPR